MIIKIALVGDYNPEIKAHQAIPGALKYSSEYLNINLNFDWINTETITSGIGEQFKSYKGIWVVPASPYKNMNGVINVIKHARENKIPLLGTCGGFQHLIIEFFRNVIGYNSADSSEIKTRTGNPRYHPINMLSYRKGRGNFFKRGKQTKKFCNADQLTEKFHCSYGFNSKYIDLLKKSKLKISGVDINEEVRIVELEDHPFYLATLFQPERSALLNKISSLGKFFY